MMLSPNTLDFGECHVMAIVNVTPDSFYAASRMAASNDVAQAVCRAVEAGATIVDVGGYSSRPGADDVPLEEEWRRVDMALGAISALKQGVVVSIDTFRSEIVRRTVEGYGAVIVNDISAGEQDAEMFRTVAHYGLPYVAMHMRGVPETMQSLTDYEDGVVADVRRYFEVRIKQLLAAGVRRENIILDPGFGFAKSVEQNYQLMRGLGELRSLGYPLLVGVSRKSMIYKPLGVGPEEALAGSLALGWEALRQGATILRVHDVAATRQIVDIFEIYKSRNND